MDLIQLTTLLKRHMKDLKAYYESHEPPKNRRDHGFFSFVKTQTEPIHILLAEWEEKALHTLKQRQGIHVYPQQIISSKENMRLLIMHSYYIDTRKRIYMEMYKSVQYVLDQLLHDLQSGS